jgi:hypothetical protein
MTTYYTLDSRKLSYAEFWRITRKPASFLVAAIAKVLGAKINFKSTVARVDALTILQVADVPEHVRNALAGILSQCQAQGLQLQFWYTVPPVRQDAEGYGAAMLSSDGTIVANVLFARVGATQRTVFGFTSLQSGGRLIATSGEPKRFNTPPQLNGEHMPGSAFDAVLARHRQRITDRGGDGVLRVPASDVASVILALNNLHIDYQIQRGVYVPAAPPQ